MAGKRSFVTVKGQASLVKAAKHLPNGVEVFLKDCRFSKKDEDALNGMVDAGCKVHVTIEEAEKDLPGMEGVGKKKKKGGDAEGQQSFA